MNNPLVEVEDRKAWTDFGRQAYMVYLGAREEGASDQGAQKMVMNFFAGMFEGVNRANNYGKDGNQ